MSDQSEVSFPKISGLYSSKGMKISTLFQVFASITLLKFCASYFFYTLILRPFQEQEFNLSECVRIQPMPKEVLRHLSQIGNPEEKVNCATTSLYALLGDVRPKKEFEDAVFVGTFDIVHLAVVAAIELYEQKQWYSHLSGPVEMSISDYLKELREHNAKHPNQAFRGMLVSCQARLSTGPQNHVFVVTSLPKGGKVDWVDTAPGGANPKTMYVRKNKPISTLDKIAKPINASDYPAVAIFSEPLSSPGLQARQAKQEIENVVSGWYQTAEAFVWYANHGQFMED